MLIFLCAVVSKTLIFLTFSPFCQNSSSLSAIIYYLSDTCIFQGFSLWIIVSFFTGFHVIKIWWNRNNDCFWLFRPVLVVSGMAGENTAHRPPSRLALSPPSKIKAPCRFFIRPGKHSSFFKIPYQSPKKCLKTQITTFSILKFSPKAKNTPVLTVFTLFPLFVSSSHCYYHRLSVTAIILLLLSSPHRTYHHPAAFAFLKIPRGKTYSHHRVSAPVHQHFEVPRSTVRFWDSRKYHTKSPTKTICSEVFFWVCFGFLSFSFAITVLSCFVPQTRVFISLLRFRLYGSFFLFYDFVYSYQTFSFTTSFIFIRFFLAFFSFVP